MAKGKSMQNFSKAFTSIAGAGLKPSSPAKPKGESDRGLMAFGKKKGFKK